MKFEDLFAESPSNYVEQYPSKKKERNYVEAAAPEANKLEKFLAERTIQRPPPEAYNMFGRNFVGGDLGATTRPLKGGEKEVAKAVDDETAQIAAMTPKMKEDKAARIRAMFQSTPELIPDEPGMEAPGAEVPPQVPPTTLNQAPQVPEANQTAVQKMANRYGIDVEEVKKMAGELAPEFSGTDFMVGLVPAIVDLLAKGRGEGLAIAGQHLVGKVGEREKRRQTLEDKLIDMERARAIAGARANAGSKSFQSVNIVDPDTKEIIKANFDKNTGKYYSPNGVPLSSEKIRAGFSVIPEEDIRRVASRLEAAKEKTDYTPRIDTESGLLSRATPTGMVPIGQQKHKLDPKQEKDLTQLTDKFISADVYKKPTAALMAAANIRGLLTAANSGNAVAANSARVQLARMSGDVGALSDSDIERSGGSPAIHKVIERYINLQSTYDPLLPEDIRNLTDVAKIYENNARLKLGEAVDKLDKTFVSEYGGKKGSVKSKMKAYIPTKSSAPVPRVSRLGPDGKIYTYTLNSKTGKYE